MKLHCCPQTGIHFLFFPRLALGTITLIRKSNNVLLTPIVLTVCRIFHSSGASHYLSSQILWHGRCMPASQVYQWQRGLRSWPHTSKLKQSQSFPPEYYEPLLRCDSESLSIPFSWIIFRFSLELFYKILHLFISQTLIVHYVAADEEDRALEMTRSLFTWCWRILDWVGVWQGLLKEETFEQMFILSAFKIESPDLCTVKVQTSKTWSLVLMLFPIHC